MKTILSIAVFTALMGYVIYVVLFKPKREKQKVIDHFNKNSNAPFVPRVSVIVSENTLNNDINFKMLNETTAQFIPESPLPLTLINCTKQDAEAILNVFINTYKIEAKNYKVYELFALKNIVCKEIEDYIEEYTPLYKKYVVDIINQDKDTDAILSADEINYLEISTGIKESASKKIDKQPVVSSFYRLFDSRPESIDWDDEIIRKYSYDGLKIYFKYYQIHNTTRFFSVTADQEERKYMEQLVAHGLALQGTDIPFEYYLNLLAIKELAALFPRVKKAKTKNEYLNAIMNTYDYDELREVTKKRFTFKSTFMLKEIPEIDSDLACNYWMYLETYLSAFWWTLICYQKLDMEHLNSLHGNTKLKIDFNEYWCHCPYAREMAEKPFKANNIKLPPFHVGCTCEVKHF